MCGCSLRHFRRMFHEQFNTSIRAKQTELRLEKARQMLVETDEKILTIARESGYRHLGFFNAIFKRKFGVTPTACGRKPGRASAAPRSELASQGSLQHWRTLKLSPCCQAPPRRRHGQGSILDASLNETHSWLAARAAPAFLS